MDCEHFDRRMLHWVYGELSEIDAAASQRHVAHCTRCNRLVQQVRATRAALVIPRVAPPNGLLDRIVAAERTTNARLPLRQRLGRFVSVAAGYAMRPQLAMAALLLLTLGTSLLFLRARPGERDSVQITERGTPEFAAEKITPRQPSPDSDDSFDLPLPGPGNDASAPPSAATREDAANDPPQQDDPKTDSTSSAGAGSVGPTPDLDTALSAYRAGDFTSARRLLDAIASSGAEAAPAAALLAGRAEQRLGGCATARPRFEQLAKDYADSQVGVDALWHAAECQREQGKLVSARESYERLRRVPAYANRAEGRLKQLDQEAPPAERRAAPQPAEEARSGAP